MKMIKSKVAPLVLVFLCSVFLLSGCEKEPTWQDHYDLGIQAMEEENYEEAISHFEDAIALDPSKPEAYSALADVYIATEDWEKALEILQQGIDETEDEALATKAEKVTAKLEELSRSQYLVDYLGVTLNELTEVWGPEYQYSGDWYLGDLKGVYYEDLRIPVEFFFSDPMMTGIVGGDATIYAVSTGDVDLLVADGIPCRVSYEQIKQLAPHGDVGEWPESGADTYTIEIGENTSAVFGWEEGFQSSSYPWVLVFQTDKLYTGASESETTDAPEPAPVQPVATSVTMSSHGGVWHSAYVAENLPMEELVIHSIENGFISFDFSCYRLYNWENIDGKFTSSNTATFSSYAGTSISGRLIFESDSITLIVDSSGLEYIPAGNQYTFQIRSNEKRL